MFLMTKGTNMKYMLVIIITIGSPVIGEKEKTLELRIPQESKIECLRSSGTFKFHLPVISMKSKCVPKLENEKPGLKSVGIEEKLIQSTA